MFGNMTSIENAVKIEMIVELKEILADEFNVLVDSFVDNAQRRLIAIKTGIANSDSEVIRTQAHSLKGSSLNLGARLLPQLCAEMEDLGKSGELSGLSSLFNKIELELARVESELSQHAAH